MLVLLGETVLRHTSSLSRGHWTVVESNIRTTRQTNIIRTVSDMGAVWCGMNIYIDDGEILKVQDISIDRRILGRIVVIIYF